ncbi:SH3 domain-containing protein [Oceanobacillus massiliensis]|uniref:SH3 domain-containing protein n=1 Tax=Oceanobacillus massiliensis TaxID=1465765 RepID=UPI000289F84F|nr:SH3 domain-containing protein [Oceanobacillus massiliensis]
MRKGQQCKFVVVSCFLALVFTLIIIPTSTSGKVFAAEIYQGVALKDSTNVYDSTSRSNVLKSYSKGSILLYTSHSGEWYSAIVYVNGKKHNGYIHKSDVDTSVSDQETLKGIGLKNSTAVYSKASTSSSKLKTYDQGHILYYETFTSEWYEAFVYINGRKTTGYINKSDVEQISENQQSLTGIGLKKPTAVYSKASTNSSKLKTYDQGHILYYETFTSGWYEAFVYINGKKTSGYIHIDDVENIQDTQESLQGRASKNPTNIYSKASRDSSVLKNYKSGSNLLFKTFSKNWYEALVYVDGKPKTGYIHYDDVTTGDVYVETDYESDYYEVVDTQMEKAPQVWKDGGFVNASSEQVAYYVNSSNFHKGDSEFFQFLDLAETAGVNANEINEKILKGKGILAGTAQSFINGGKKYSINEIYLMSHALHETGNGTSSLSIGVPVDKNGNVVSKSNAAYTVYNMYGIGAKDACPLECGAKYAFDHGWFTPEDAIVGGAAFIGNNYINSGQNTLYKMRWNPDAPGSHQYATDVAWAVAQTKNISNLYNLIEDYILVFDIPKYENQPDSSGNPNSSESSEAVKTAYPNNVYGIVDADPSLNIRSTPNGSKIGSLADGTSIKVQGTNNNNWYKVTSGGKTGWVHSDYVNLINLLEVTATNLNVRETPNGTKVGSVSNELLAAVLDSNNKIVRQNEWYKIYYNGKQAWVSGGTNGTQYIRIK